MSLQETKGLKNYCGQVFCYNKSRQHPLREKLIDLNVLAVITDRHLQTCQQGEVVHYMAQVVSVSDYYPFGIVMKERSYQAASYAFGFNGMLKDDELKGEGNSLDFGARIYDSRLGRWLSVDPMFNKYPNFSPYNAMLNSPLILIDQIGEDVVIYMFDSEMRMKPLIILKSDKTIGVNVTKYIPYDLRSLIGTNFETQIIENFDAQIQDLPKGSDAAGLSFSFEASAIGSFQIGFDYIQINHSENKNFEGKRGLYFSV